METRENMNPIGVPKNLVLSTCCIHGIDLSICPMAEGFIRVGESNRLFWGTFPRIHIFPCLDQKPKGHSRQKRNTNVEFQKQNMLEEEIRS